MRESVEAKIRLLERMPIFGGIRTDIIELLIERVRDVSITAGDYFIREGSRGTSAFVLEEGSVSILKSWRDEDYFLHHLKSGSCFGDGSTLS